MPVDLDPQGKESRPVRSGFPSWLPVMLIVALAACNPRSSDESLGERFDLGPEGVEMASIAGASPLAVPVRAVNAWGVPVPADPLTVRIVRERCRQRVFSV